MCQRLFVMVRVKFFSSFANTDCVVGCHSERDRGNLSLVRITAMLDEMHLY
jgi:hypothetical protein